MDPFSLSVSVLTVVTIASKLVVIGDTYCKALRGRSTEVQLLVREIGLLSGVLNLISTNLDARSTQNISPSILAGPIEECKSQLLELHEFLVRQLGGKNRLRRFGRRLKWPLKEKETKEWIERIERFKRTFLLGLQVDEMLVPFTHRGMSG
jgi:hypothetical protein